MAGMKQQLAEMEAIAAQTDAPTFDNTIVAIEKSGALLTRVRNVFSNMTSAEKSKDLQNIETELAPLQAAHSDNILLNRRLFARVEKLYDTRDSLGLNEEQREVLKQHYESFVRAGAKLDEAQQARIRLLNEQLSKLETKFEENLLAISEERSVFIDDVAELDGMSDADIAAAAEGAKARGKDGKYLLEITNTTRVPILSFAEQSCNSETHLGSFRKSRVGTRRRDRQSPADSWRSLNCGPNARSCWVLRIMRLSSCRIRWPKNPQQLAKCWRI